MSAPQNRPGRVLNAPGAARAQRRSSAHRGPPAGGPPPDRQPAAATAPPAAHATEPAGAGSEPHPRGTETPPPRPGALADAGEQAAPCLEQVKAFVQSLIVAEKNLQLYPAYSKVVRQSNAKFFECLRAFIEARGEALQLKVAQKDLVYEEEVVYHEEHTGKSLAYRLYSDGVRAIAFLEDSTDEETNSFLECFKELRKSGEEDDDFGTLFWEKDCANIQLQIIDDTDSTAEDEIPDVPMQHIFSLGFEPGRLDLDPEEENRLKEELSGQLGRDDGDSTFELTEEEAQRIRELALAEETYFPVYDFVDILIELMIKNGDPSAFTEAAKMIRSIVFALVENLDFEHAAELLRQLSEDAHPGLTKEHKRQIQEMIGSFCDKQTLALLDDYLKENPRLPAEHGVFRFLKVFDRNAVASFCKLLKHASHAGALVEVLLVVGRNAPGVVAKFLGDPDPNVARGALQVIARGDDPKKLARVSAALKHHDEGIRQMAAKLIIELADTDATQYLLPLLEETRPQLLNFALTFFAKVPSPDAYPHLRELAMSPRFFELDKGRQALCFKAVIAAGGEDGLRHVTDKVLRRVFCFGTKSRRRKMAALLALSSSTDDRSIAALQKFAISRSTLATTAKHALRLMAAEASETERAPPSNAASTEPASGSNAESNPSTETREVEHASH